MGSSTAHLLDDDADRRYAELCRSRDDRSFPVGSFDVAQPCGLGAAHAVCDPSAGFGRRRGTGAHCGSDCTYMPEIVQPQPHLPDGELRPAWRAAVLAYRANMRVTRHPSPAYEAALAAFREVLPDMPIKEAERQMTLAVAYAAANHPSGSGAASTASANPCEAAKAIDLRQDIFFQKEPRL